MLLCYILEKVCCIFPFTSCFCFLDFFLMWSLVFLSSQTKKKNQIRQLKNLLQKNSFLTREDILK